MDKVENTTLQICKRMTLEIKEVRGTSSMTSFKEGFNETSSDTRTQFHWKLRGIASKLGPEIVQSDDFDPEKQEVYDTMFQSQGFDHGHFGGFKSREDAIRNALAFAKRNGIEVDGYTISESGYKAN